MQQIIEEIEFDLSYLIGSPPASEENIYIIQGYNQAISAIHLGLLQKIDALREEIFNTSEDGIRPNPSVHRDLSTYVGMVEKFANHINTLYESVEEFLDQHYWTNIVEVKSK